MTKLVCLLLATLVSQAAAQTGSITSEMIATSLVEDAKPVRLELLVRKPDGAGPFPTVVFNHGSTGRGDNPARFRQSWSSQSAAQYFSLGVVNFVGGWMGDGCANAAAINTTAFKRGAPFPRPTLWLYGERDPFYYLSHSKANFEAFTAAGGKGRFEAFSVPGHNAGHGLIAHPGLWGEHVTRYLQSLE
jgi:hypothetical protein